MGKVQISEFFWGNSQGLTRYLGSKNLQRYITAKLEPEMADKNRMLVEGVENYNP